jgi:catechol 2,3-dioxygenase-like lactoylglutathione lyase family enzyme
MLQAAIPVLHMANADSSHDFYCRELGFRLAAELPASDTARDPCYMVIARDNAVLHLSSHSGDSVPGSVAYIPADSVGALHAEFVARGVKIHIAPVDQTWGMRELYVRDPDGNSIRFGQPVAG